jgi:hypothetical protein
MKYALRPTEYPKRLFIVLFPTRSLVVPVPIYRWDRLIEKSPAIVTVLPSVTVVLVPLKYRAELYKSVVPPFTKESIAPLVICEAVKP